MIIKKKNMNFFLDRENYDNISVSIPIFLFTCGIGYYFQFFKK